MSPPLLLHFGRLPCGVVIAAAAIALLCQQGFAARVNNDLSCYQCKSSSLSECRLEKYLKPCGNDQAFDTCQTVIQKTPGNTNMTVSKSCALSPCFLDSEGNSALAMSKSCDTGADSFNCVYCCKESGCNGADAILGRTTAPVMLLMMSATLTWATT